MKPTRLLSRSRVTALSCALASACSGGADAGPAASAVRDSAGVRIVENLSPRLPPGSWRLSPEPVVEIDGDAAVVEEVPLDPVSVFEGADRRIVVGDGNQVGWDAVLVYDSTGAFLFKMGGAGEGPGEFRGQLWSAVPYRGDSIAAWDRRGPFIRVYGPDGGYARELLLPQPPVVPPEGTMGFSAGFVGALSDGSFVSLANGILDLPAEPGPVWYKHLLLRIDAGGSAYDTIGDFRFAQFYHWDGTAATQMALPHSVHEVAYGDELIRASTEGYAYEVTGQDGSVRMIVRREATPVAVGPEHIEERVESMRAMGGSVPEERLEPMLQRVRSAPTPATMPLHSSLLAGPDGEVWVERFRWYDPWTLPPDPRPSTWDVFSADGEWLAEVEVPARVVLRAVSETRAYGVRIDELTVKHIVAYRLTRGAGEP